MNEIVQLLTQAFGANDPRTQAASAIQTLGSLELQRTFLEVLDARTLTEAKLNASVKKALAEFAMEHKPSMFVEWTMKPHVQGGHTPSCNLVWGSNSRDVRLMVPYGEGASGGLNEAKKLLNHLDSNGLLPAVGRDSMNAAVATLRSGEVLSVKLGG